MVIYNVTCWFTVMINLTNARSVLSPLPSTATYRPTCTSILGRGPIVAGRYSNSLTRGKGGTLSHKPNLICAREDSRELKQRRTYGNANGKKAMGLLSKTTALPLHCTFLFISLSLLHDYNVKLRSFTSYGDWREHKTTIFFFFSELRYSDDLEIIPTFDKSCEWIRIRLMKFETALIHF